MGGVRAEKGSGWSVCRGDASRARIRTPLRLGARREPPGESWRTPDGRGREEGDPSGAEGRYGREKGEGPSVKTAVGRGCRRVWGPQGSSRVGMGGRPAIVQGLALASPTVTGYTSVSTFSRTDTVQWRHGAISSEDLAWGKGGGPSLGDTDTPSPVESEPQGSWCWRCPAGTQGLCLGAGSVATLHS